MRLGAILIPGDIVQLVGELGSGKTTLVQGISTGWGSTDPVTSPSYVLVNVYRRPDRQRLFHLDAYRLENPTEAMELDLLSFIENGPLVVEWADRINAALPAEFIKVSFKWVDIEQRDLLFTVQGDRYQKKLEILRSQVFGVFR